MGLPWLRAVEGYPSGLHLAYWSHPVVLLPRPGPWIFNYFEGQVWALSSVSLLKSWKVFGLPPSVLCCASQEPAGTEEAYKAAVDSFLHQQHMLGVEGCASPVQGEDQLHPSHSQEPEGPAGFPVAAQTEALSKLFNSIKTLTAKEELLQTLR